MITSPANPRLRLLRRLHARAQRQRLGLFACEGEDLVAAGLDAGLVPVEALVDAEAPALLDRLPGAEPVEPRVLAGVSELAHPPRIVAVFRHGDLLHLDPAAPPPVGLALWRVADPGNVGALVRSADAFGPAYVCLSRGCADPTGPKATRASMGSIFRVALGSADAAPRPWVGLVASAGTPLPTIELPSDRVTFVLGAEREGLPAEIAGTCDELATIPLAARAESLGVAAAGAIALYDRSRRAPADHPG